MNWYTDRLIEETYADINGREWSYVGVVRCWVEDTLIPESRKRFEEKYKKNKGKSCIFCGRM